MSKSKHSFAEQLDQLTNIILNGAINQPTPSTKEQILLAFKTKHRDLLSRLSNPFTLGIFLAEHMAGKNEKSVHFKFFTTLNHGIFKIPMNENFRPTEFFEKGIFKHQETSSYGQMNKFESLNYLRKVMVSEGPRLPIAVNDMGFVLLKQAHCQGHTDHVEFVCFLHEDDYEEIESIAKAIKIVKDPPSSSLPQINVYTSFEGTKKEFKEQILKNVPLSKEDSEFLEKFLNLMDEEGGPILSSLKQSSENLNNTPNSPPHPPSSEPIDVPGL